MIFWNGFAHKNGPDLKRFHETKAIAVIPYAILA